MIRLRRTLERAQRHRWLWILVLVLLAVLLALVALHSTNDAAGAVDGPLVCMAIMVLVAVVASLPRPRLLVVTRRTRDRAPPQPLLPARLPLPAAPRPVLALRL